MALRAYMAFRRWIDHDLSRGSRVGHPFEAYTDRPFVSFMVPSVPAFIAVGTFGLIWRADASLSSLEYTVAYGSLGIALILVAFVGWRLQRLMRARAIKMGRLYERKSRYALPPEYADSEDALLAARRRAH
jgi:hypothetical protein